MNIKNSLFSHIHAPIQANLHVIEKAMLQQLQRCAPVQKKDVSKEPTDKRHKEFNKKNNAPSFRSYSPQPLFVDTIIE